MHRIKTYLPQDRLRALANGISLPERGSGSAIFADISGFTALGEALTKSLGARKGVDVLSQRLNAVYTALIAQVDQYGGSIISFAGDSIVGWFEEAGSSSALRAVTCAQNMQSVMKEFNELAIKISVTTGSARRFIVGNPNIQIIDTLAGEMIARLATAEQLAEKGEILFDQATLQIIENCAVISETRNFPDTQENFFVLASLTDPSSPQPLQPFDENAITNESLRPWLLSTVYEREISNIGSFLTELRPATPVFVNFSGIDYNNDEQAGEKLNEFVSHAQDIVAQYGGSVLQLTIGDKGSYIYAVFGAPTAHEDNTDRAVYAALELRQIPQKLGFIRPVQIGISLGTLRVGGLGGEMRQTFAALGDDVNLAARLMSVARPDEILITGKAQIEVADAFSLEPHEPIAIKGLRDSQTVYSVTGISHHRATRLPEPTYRLPMVGRQNELSLVEEKMQLAAQGKGQILGIVAEAGMGKSRLVAEIIRLARKRSFIGYGGACQSSGTNTAYLVWRPIWQAFFDLDPDMPKRKQIRLVEGEVEERTPERLDALPLLGSLLDLPLPENDFTRALEPKDRKGVLEALLEDCLRSASQETPLLIVIEDMHWIDPLSNDLLDTLAHISDDLPVCFVLAYRPPDMVRLQKPRIEELPYFTKIELNELEVSETEQLIRLKLKQIFPERTGDLPKALVDVLTAKSQGNPFFIEELINYLHDRGLNPFDTGALETLDLPASLQTLILSRVDQLTEPQKVTLKVASVIGRVFPFSWLHGYYPSLGEPDLIRTNLSELSRLDLTPLDTPDPELAYLFKHIITQEVAYESLSYATRAQLHELLARYLESRYPEDPPLDVLTFHYSHSENLSKKREYMRRSAEAAFSFYDNTTALEYYKQALTFSPELSESIDMHLKSGDILFMIGKRNEAKVHYETALQLARENNMTAEIVECQIKCSVVSENYEQSLEWLNKAQELAQQSNNPAGTCDVFKELSNIYWRSGKYDLALQCAEQSAELARSLQDKKREALAFFFSASIHSERGEYAESRKFFEASLAISRELNDTRHIGSTLLNWGTTYYYIGDYTTAEKYITESLDFYREIGDKRSTAIAMNNLGNIFFLRGDYQTAQKYYNDSLTLGRDTEDKYIKSLSSTSLGITLFQEGRLDEADAYYKEGMDLSRQLNHTSTIALLHCYQGLLALARGQFSAARESFFAGLKLTHESNIKAYFVYNLTGTACLSLAENRLPLAVTLLSASSAIAASIGFKMEPELQQPYDRALASVKEKLSEEEFSSAWDEGQAMTTVQAFETAMNG